MSKVDWSKAPNWASSYGATLRSNSMVFFSDDKYQYLDSGKIFAFNCSHALGLEDIKLIEKRPEKQVEKTKPEKDGNKYHREIIGFCGTMIEVDVYRVLDAFKTESPAIDHAVKKMLCTGIRGHKDYLTDIDNAIESLQEAKLLYLQKQEIDKA